MRVDVDVEMLERERNGVEIEAKADARKENMRGD